MATARGLQEIKTPISFPSAGALLLVNKNPNHGGATPWQVRGSTTSTEDERAGM